jgi:hypothetical protein
VRIRLKYVGKDRERVGRMRRWERISYKKNINSKKK